MLVRIPLLWRCFLWIVLFKYAASAVAVPPKSRLPDDLAKPPTIIDYLSSDVQYSYFLRHLQRLGLVPTINAMENVTVFAPINSAFVDGDIAAKDTPENILRYFANQRLRISYLENHTTIVDSLYVVKHFENENRSFPLKLSGSCAEGHVPDYKVNDVAEVVEFDAYAKHQHSFIQAIDRLLPHSMSMCEFLMDQDPQSYDVNGHDISFIKQVFQSIFTPPPFRHKKPLQTCEEFLANTSTLLLPTDRYFNQSMSDLELRYYLTIHHGLENLDLFPTKEAWHEIRSDALSMVSNLLLSDLVGGVNGTSPFESHASVLGSSSHKLAYDVDSDRVLLNNKTWSVAGSTSLTFSDGLLHLFDSDNNNGSESVDLRSAFGIEPLTLIPRKVLFAMHYSQLVRELKFWKKGSLIGKSAGNQTIIVEASDRDDFFDDSELVLSRFHDGVERSDDSNHDVVDTLSFSNRQQMLYKFLDGTVDIRAELSPERPMYKRLIDSKLCSKKRIGSCYKVKVCGKFQNGQSKVTFNDHYDMRSPVYAHGNNSIYVSDLDFASPVSFKNALSHMLSDGLKRNQPDHVTIDKDSCLQTLKYLDKFKLLSLPDNHKGYTIFLPCGRKESDHDVKNKQLRSWKSLGLVLNYLERNPEVFKRILQSLFLEDLIYSDFGMEDSEISSKLVRTISGEIFNVSETFQEGDNHVISLNQTAISVPLNSDFLFDQGVIHVTQDVLLPEDFSLSLKDLIDAAQDSPVPTSSFIRFVEKYPKLAEYISLADKEGSKYSLLVPTTESLQSLNITSSYERLWEFLELHLIANSEAHTILGCMNIPGFASGNYSEVIQTNRSNGVFKCHTTSSGKTYLSLWRTPSAFEVLANKEHQVRILNYGCSKQHSSGSGCVFLIDSPLDVRWFDPQDNFLHVHIGWISVGIGIIIGVILFGFCTTTMALCLTRGSKQKKPVALPEANFKPPGASYMRVTSGEEDQPLVHDYGYETDDDMTRNETDKLLKRSGRGSQPRNYASMSPIAPPSAPLKIKTKGVIQNINRERNLPPLDL